QDLDRILDELRAIGVAADWTAEHEVTVMAANLQPAPNIMGQSLIGWSPLMLVALAIRCQTVKLTVGPLAMLDDRTKFLLSVLELVGVRSDWHHDVLSLPRSHQHAAEVDLSTHQVEGTLLTLLLAARAEGESRITGAAEDPGVEDRLDCLGSMGVYIR